MMSSDMAPFCSSFSFSFPSLEDLCVAVAEVGPKVWSNYSVCLQPHFSDFADSSMSLSWELQDSQKNCCHCCCDNLQEWLEHSGRVRILFLKMKIHVDLTLTPFLLWWGCSLWSATGWGHHRTSDVFSSSASSGEGSVWAAEAPNIYDESGGSWNDDELLKNVKASRIMRPWNWSSPWALKDEAAGFPW